MSLATEVVLVTGMSGSGKSVALHALEDAGYYCVDNLPPELLSTFVLLERNRGAMRVAVAVDIRSADTLPLLPQTLDTLRQSEGIDLRCIYLDTDTPVLLRRYSETRRPHPLSRMERGTVEGAELQTAIDEERHLLAEIRERSAVIDTTDMRPATLRRTVLDLIQAPPAALQIVLMSFAFKRGVPLNADFVFDLRCLPNPYYERELRPLTGRDAPVADYLRAQPESGALIGDIEGFLQRWIPNFNTDQRSYLTIGIGCTGGQHRSVYAVEELARRLSAGYRLLVRHRELDKD